MNASDHPDDHSHPSDPSLTSDHAACADAEPPVFVLIPTHTPRYLALVLMALAAQTHAPAHIVVSCDTDDAEIGRVIERVADEHRLNASWVRRAHHGNERLCQVRNNGVRHIMQDLGYQQGQVLVLDGDMLAPPNTVALHAAFASRADLVYPYRTNLTREASEALEHADNPAPALARTLIEHPTDTEIAELDQRDRRYRKQLLMRLLGLGPKHKPKLLGGHFSVDLNWYLRLNGFDELYQGWGFKDDEFAYRAAKLGARTAVAVSAIAALHLWHETRQAAVPMAQLPTAKRFAQRAKLPLVAEHGVENPLDQHPIRVDVFGR